ncbi:MAG: zinc metallopeptidase [Verrucomicrobiaceae bacterium]|nr:zinc metallopeptidase [Verrucomicrobiaceae bacterium]
MLGILIIVVLLAFGASHWSLQRYEEAVARGGRWQAPLPFTGAEIALAFLEDAGVTDVQIIEHNGVVTDYFDPARRRLFLRREFKDGHHLAAWAVALHEAAHALQTGDALAELKWRRSCITMTRYVPTLVLILVVALKFLKIMPSIRVRLFVAAAACAIVLLLNIGTLAVERNANLRLRRFLDERLNRHDEARERLDSILSAAALREVGDLIRSPRYFFFSALPGSGKARPE